MNNRVSAIDFLRGAAIILMVVYHICYDLNYFNFINIDFVNSAFWVGFRTLIVSLFLVVSGTSLSLSVKKLPPNKRFWNREGTLILCACLVTLASFQLFPESYIFFGVLHFLALASVLGLLFLPAGKFNIVIGMALILFGLRIKHPFFDDGLMQWFGLTTYLPNTADYVPLLPWFGVYLTGIGLGKCLKEYWTQSRFYHWQARSKLSKGITFGGRHSLIIYMTHQVVLFGVIGGIYYLVG